MEPNLVYFVISLLACALSLFLATNALDKRSAPGAIPFGIFLLILAVWALMVGVGMVESDPIRQIIWTDIRMSMVIAIPVVWLVFTLSLTERKWFRSYHTYLLTIIPVISFCILVTNPLHHLYYREIGYTKLGSFYIETTWKYGSYFWIHAVYSYLLMVIGCSVLAYQSIKGMGRWKRQAGALAVGMSFPFIVNIAYTFHLFPSVKVDYNPIGFLLLGIFMSISLFRYNMFDIKPIARKILVDSMTDPMLVLDDQNNLVDSNPAAERLFDLSTAQSISQAVENLLPLSQPRPDEEALQVEYTYEKDGNRRVFDLRAPPIKDNNRFLGRLIVLREITERQALEEELWKMATLDSLTGVLNRRSFYERAVIELQRARRYSHPFAILFFDLDNFKEINDRYGHSYGDNALIHVANICKNHTRSSDLLTRYGGDEFVVMQPETNLEESLRMADRLRTAICSAPLTGERVTLTITASIGIRFYNPSSEAELSLEHIIEQADRMMYLSKQKGNCVTVWEANPADRK